MPGKEMRKTKIVATLGPASAATETISRMISAGVNVFRLNFSHADHAFHKLCAERVRQAAREADRSVGILADLQGPKIRTGQLREGSVELVEGQTFTITTERMEGDDTRVSTNYPGLVDDVSPGDLILVDDGKIRLSVKSVQGTEVKTTVVNGGELSARKALNLPGTVVTTPAMTEKDKKDLAFALEQLEVDYVALSFVREASDVELLKRQMQESGVKGRVICKIEKPQAVENFDAILDSLELGDGIMIARGDLGVEVDIEKVPALQKRMINKANKAGMLCITATQMLESMIDDSMPSRAEASDIFNASLDGTDAVMLSGETAIGKHPVEAVRYMGKIIEEAESYEGYLSHSAIEPIFTDHTFGLATVRAACAAAETANAKGLVCLTYSGRTALLMSKLSMPRETPFFAMTANEKTYNRLSLYFGVHPILLDNELEVGTDLWDLIDSALDKSSDLRKGDTVVIASGYKISDGHTNVCKIVKLGHREFY